VSGELGFEHRLQELAGSIPKLAFNRVEPVIEKMCRCLDFRLRQARRRDMAEIGTRHRNRLTQVPLNTWAQVVKNLKNPESF
jgi:hypothetical protein